MRSFSDELINSISLPRLSFYERYLGCTEIHEKIGSYIAYQYLSSDFFPVLQMIEVALRNTIDNTLKKSNGDDWYDDIPVTEKSKNYVITAKNVCPRNYSRNDVISRLPFGFWVYLLDSPYRNTNHSSYIWTPENKELSFSKAISPFGQKMTIKAIFDELHLILDFRNRLFHHEPIWKKHNCNSHEKALNNIKKEYKSLRRVLGYLSPDKNKLIGITQRESKVSTSCNTQYIESIVDEVRVLFSDKSQMETH